ncbi:hypothetical protein ACTFIZ_009427 [Dictyostelium cf. discoideum]
MLQLNCVNLSFTGQIKYKSHTLFHSDGLKSLQCKSCVDNVANKILINFKQFSDTTKVENSSEVLDALKNGSLATRQCYVKVVCPLDQVSIVLIPLEEFRNPDLSFNDRHTNKCIENSTIDHSKTTNSNQILLEENKISKVLLENILIND